MLVPARYPISSEALLACLLVALPHTCTWAQTPTIAKDNGRIYVPTVYRLKLISGAEFASRSGSWFFPLELGRTAG
jgi:hypothetical protein